MKIIEKCSACGTKCESRNDWESLEEFHAACARGEVDIDEFEHDLQGVDCGGTLSFEEENTEADFLGRRQADCSRKIGSRRSACFR